MVVTGIYMAQTAFNVLVIGVIIYLVTREVITFWRERKL